MKKKPIDIKNKKIIPVNVDKAKMDSNLPVGNAASDQSKWFYLGGILLLTVIAYWPVFKAEFVNWDDPDYVANNLTIRSLSNIKAIFTTPIQGNFHPLSMLSLAFNYAISGMEPGSYHVLNLLFHLINIVLVFYFVNKLTEQKFWIATVTALLFALHPLHVESVAWVAERKDVLYTTFFIAGLIAYLNYLKSKKISKLIPVLFFYLLSLMSKPAAVIFPVVLLAIDLYFERLKNLNTYFEKIPFFLLALILGVLTLQAQTAKGAVADVSLFPFVFRFFFGFYGIMMYLINTVFPFNLCTFYPYPPVNQSLPTSYYLSIIVTIGLAFVFFYSLNKHKIIGFGLLFFIVNLVLCLHFFSVGCAFFGVR